MDKKSKAVFVILAILIIIAVVATFYRTIVRKDYEIFVDETGEPEEVLTEEEFMPVDEFMSNEISEEMEAGTEGTEVMIESQ